MFIFNLLGLKKLRKHTSKQEEELPRFLFRGMSNMIINDDEENAFLKDGGTEVAPMSTSTKFEVAAQYSCNKGQEGESSLIMKLRIPTNGFMQYGVDVSWLSAFPAEGEILYPPLTFLNPTNKKLFDIEGVTFTVVEVDPTWN